MTAIIFLGRCNFRCPFCHNRDLVICPDELPDLDFEKILDELKERKKWVDAVELTGGEPTIYPNIEEMSQKIKDCDFLVKLDTNGTNPDITKKLIDKKLVDYIAMDIKNHLKKYNEASGVKVDTAKIKASIKQIMSSGIDYEFRTTVVSGLHTKQDMHKIGDLVRGAKLFYIQNFEPQNTVDPEFEKKERFTIEDLKEFKEILEKYVDKVEIR